MIYREVRADEHLLASGVRRRNTVLINIMLTGLVSLVGAALISRAYLWFAAVRRHAALDGNLK